MKQQLKTLCAAIVLSLAALTAAAQATTHEVQRGETLESVAAKYGLTTETLLQSNPDAADVFFTGMKLVIPAAKAVTQPASQQAETPATTVTPAVPIATVESPTANLGSQRVVSTAQTAEDFDYYGLSYSAAFEDASHGFYALDAQRLAPSGWGIAFRLGANYGLIKSDYAGVFCYMGPAYGYVVSKNVLLSASFSFVGSYCGTGEEMNEKQNAKGETSHYKGNDLKFGWGLALTPKVVFKANKVHPFAGLDFGWAKDAKEISVSFTVGLALKI